MTPSELVKINNNIVMPAVNSSQAVEAWKQYEEMKKAIVNNNDIQKIGDKDFLKKSYWRKIATFFNLTIEIVNEKQEQIGKTVVWHFTCKAIAPNGRSAVGVGSCDAYEKAELIDGKYMMADKNNVTEWGKTAKGKPYPKSFLMKPAQPNSIHNIRSTAETIATNRAISNLVGGGEVSAEEVDGIGSHEETSSEKTPKKSTTIANINDFQQKKIVQLAIELGYTEESIKKELLEKYEVDSFEKIPFAKAGDEISSMIEKIETKGKEKKS